MKAVLTVIGNDRKGIIAGISNTLADNSVNIIDISQTILDGMFTMIMIVDMDDKSTEFSHLSDLLVSKGEELGVKVTVTREEIYKSMHRI